MNVRSIALLSLAVVACSGDPSSDGGGGSGGNGTGGSSNGGNGSGEGAGGSSLSANPTTVGGAGGGGGGEGGATGPSAECVQYCDEFLPNCNRIADVEAYQDLADCLQACATFAHGNVGTFAGDTVECRIAHLTFDPDPGPGYYELHCFHTQEHPTGQCI